MTAWRLRLLLIASAWSWFAAADVVHDDLGLPVELETTSPRIVTLSPHATELAIAAGLSDRLVAISLGGSTPPGLDGLPRIGGPGALDRERLLALRPDLVIAWQSGNRAQDLTWLTRNGIAVYRSEPTSVEQIGRSIVQLGVLGGTSSVARDNAALFAHGVRSPCRELPRAPVYVIVWERPAMTVGGRHWLNDVLHSAGLRNYFEDLPRGVFAVADEVRVAAGRLPPISLLRRHDGSAADRLADQLSMPGPRLTEAIQSLCLRRLAMTNE